MIIQNIRDVSILIPKQATAQETYSATMLKEYLGKMLDTTLPVVQEPRVVKGKMISVGSTAAAAAANITADSREQAYKLEVFDGNLFILGGTRGPIYGVIALLEEDLGCRWYAKDDDPVIPVYSQNAITVVPRSYSPPFEIREPLYKEALIDTEQPETATTYQAWIGFNRIQPLSYSSIIPQEKGCGLAHPGYFIHTYDILVPADTYFADHPEYFPLLGGQRHPSTFGNGQLCYTSTGVVDVIVKKIEVEIAKNPGTRIYSVSANDNINANCECAPCQEIIKVDGVPGVQLFLANEVANTLAVKYPEIKITTLAYEGSQKPPTNILPGSNTVIFYAPIKQRFNTLDMLLPIGDIGEIREELAAWRKISPHIYLWDYVDCIAGAPVPFPNFDAQDRGWQFLIDNGVTGVFMQGSFLGHASLGALKSWLYAKKLWNPQWPQGELIEEFIASYYGPAAGEMSEYVALQRRTWASFYLNRKEGEGLTFSKAELAQMYRLLNTAMGHCRGQSEYTGKVERELLTLLCLSLSRNPDADTAASYAAKLKQAEALITKLNVTLFGEGGAKGATAEDCLGEWRIKLNRATGVNPLPQYGKRSVTLKEAVCGYVAGDLTPKTLADDKATLGNAIWQAGGNNAWAVQWKFGDIIDRLEPGKVYIVRMRVKQQFKDAVPQESGTLFTFGSYTFGGAAPGGHRPILSARYSADDRGQYRWIELGKLQIETPNATGFFYCVPGKDLTRDDAVWYDYLEFVPEDDFKDSELADRLQLIKI